MPGVNIRQTLTERGCNYALCTVALYRSAYFFARRDPKADIFMLILHAIDDKKRGNIRLTPAVYPPEITV